MERKQVTATVPVEVVDQVKALATHERRAFSAMLALLVEEALAARKKGPGWFPPIGSAE